MTDKVKIYTATAVLCTVLVIIVLIATIVVIKKRLPMTIMRSMDERMGRKKKGSIDISKPQDPWTTNEKLKQAYPSIIRSHVWFDSLQR